MNEYDRLIERIAKGELSSDEAMEQIHSTQEKREKPFAKTFVFGEPLLRDHQLFQEQVLMGVTHCSLALEAIIGKEGADHGITIANINFKKAVSFTKAEEIQIEVFLKDNHFENVFKEGKVSAEGQYEVKPKKANPINIKEKLSQSKKIVEGKEFYAHQDSYRDSLYTVQHVYELQDGLLSQYTVQDEMKAYEKQYQISPAVMDAGYITGLFAAGLDHVRGSVWVPLYIKQLTVTEKATETGYCFAQLRRKNREMIVVDLAWVDDQGKVFLEAKGFSIKRVATAAALLEEKKERIPSPTSYHIEKPKISLGGNLREKIETMLSDHIVEMIGSEQEFDKNKNFMDLGLDSSQLIGMSQTIEKSIGIELYPTLFFEYQNAAELTEFFADEHKQAFEKYFGVTEEKIAKEEAPPQKIEKPLISIKKEKVAEDDIAIIGMAGRFAKSNNLQQFWSHLESATDLITEIPQDHWDSKEWFNPDKEASNKTYCKWGSFIQDIDKFDPLFFSVPPRQAIWMDPQLRHLLEVAQETFEDAGLAKQIRGTKTGVYVGVCFQEYWDEIVREHCPLVDYEWLSSAMSSLSGFISYIFDLQGGSIPLDNACASSLTALHLACQAIRNGECEMGFVGGINVLLSPLHYVYFSRIQALSPTGRCHTFDKRADGYIPGEGIVGVLVKPLKKALEDRDQIHAVIKGTAINHVGRSNNPTAPRVELQTRVILDAWETAGINPEDIGYLEAHGTGTELGDPIEINALKKAFKQYTKKESFCCIGSAKAHIGHLEGAAGLAGVVKAALQLKNKKIPRMPDFQELNPFIKLEKSPLKINRELTDWEVTEGKRRLVGVSSFGMTGNNSHAILEEHISDHDTPKADSDYIFVLSAKNQERLNNYIEKFLDYFETDEAQHLNIADIAYTMQIGREEMDERLAIITRSVEELKETLKKVSKGNDQGAYRGSLGKKDKKWILEGKAGEQYIQTSIQEKELKNIAQLWVSGVAFDWQLLYGGSIPRKISLPTYPFIKESYWFIPSVPKEIGTRVLHPLVHENTSTLEEEQFTSIFTGDEPFLRDHQVKGTKVLPGVAYLEMMREVVERASEEENKELILKNVIWAQPISVKDVPETVHISLFPEDSQIAVEVYTKQGVHSQAIAHYQPKTKAEMLAISSIQKECTEKTLSKQEIYSAFSELGLDYGPFHQPLEEIYVGQDLFLARLNLSDASTINDYVLHPSLMDGALQASIGFAMDKLALPFALDECFIKEPCQQQMWVVVRKADQKLNIQLCDSQGKVCVEMKGFAVRALEGEISTGALLFKPARTDKETPKPTKIGSKDLKERTALYLAELISKTLKIPVQNIDNKASFEKYGIDSIMVMDLTNALEKEFGALSKTLFFEYQTLEDLAEYFVQAHRDHLEQVLDLESQATVEEVSIERPIREKRRVFRRGRQVLVEPRGKEIAIIGIAGRYPQAYDLEAFWENLEKGKDCIEEVPKNRWDWQPYYSEDRQKAGSIYSKWGGFIEDVATFDPLFFNISPREAEIMDPQERLFLMHAWKALEDAGYTRQVLQEKFRSQVGVYAGLMYQEYQLFGSEQLAAGTTPASIANRVSYFCNFHGPSMTVDTMCSSSLTTVHLGCRALQEGRIDVAVAGGVNVSIHPNKYLMLSQGQFISSKGRCESFGEGGEGYIPGEGVGVAILKRLDDAIRDGDHIYGVIKGSALNHGGKTHGFTVPNPNAQEMVIERALKEAGIDPRTISYIEAHGTGTSLGDPIEITGLSKAFQKSSQDKQYCLIGSAKSNIGHLESAAGIAGLTKVLLQLKYGKIVPSLHSEKLNPNIHFEQTPFIVNQKLVDWKRPQIEGREVPRRAGVSSFGAGGSNAHLVIEEYQVPKVTPIPITKANPAIIVLSAKTKEQLQQQTQQLRTHLEKEKDLASIAYTLQVGREAMEERLGVIVSSLDEFKKKLDSYLKGEQQDVYLGRVKRNKDTLDLFKADEDLQKAIDAWIEKKKYNKLLDLWVKGLIFDWNHLYGDEKPQRISLPTYPFSKERYWIEEVKPKAIQGKVIHPFVHENKSNIEELHYVSTFTGTEPFLRDHQVKGTRVLPGVAYLEMMREATEQASREEDKELILKNVIWAQPISVKESPETVHISLFPEDSQIALQVYTEAGVHSQAVAHYVQKTKAETLNISSIQKECTEKMLSKQEIYSAFSQLGLGYGLFHQPLEEINVGQDILLGKLNLSDDSTLDDYVLHPSLMDGALQACIGFSLNKLALPFALDECIIKGSCQQQMWAVVCRDDKKLNIQLCDSQGKVCVEMKGFMTRVFEREVSTGTLLFKPVWKEAQPGKQEALIHKVFVCDLPNLKIDVEKIQTSAKTAETRYIDIAEKLFSKIKVLIESKPKEAHFIQVVVPSSYLGLSGFLKTATQENPKIICSLISIEPKTSKERVLAILNEYQTAPILRLFRGKVETQEWEEIISPPAPTPPWKDKGVYLITGGLGGLGFIFAKEIAKNTQNATLVLTGRSPANKAKVKELEEFGAKVRYSQTDVTDKKQVQTLFSSLKNLTGIIHSAGIIKDNFILKKNASEFTSVLKPKVLGVTYLDQACRKLKPELFITFSSVAAVLGNLGQADYAAANGYMDAYAHSHNILSINWPLWKEGGMQVDEAMEERLRKTTGIETLPTSEGIQALYQSLSIMEPQCFVLKGDRKKITDLLSQQKPEPKQKVVLLQNQEKVEKTLKQFFAEVIKVKEDELDSDVEFEEYGVDSILMMNILNRMEEEFGEAISPNILSEYQTLRALATHLVTTGGAKKTKDTLPEKEPIPSKTIVTQPQRRLTQRKLTRRAHEPSSQKIAVIGMSCRFPGGNTVESFWKNLVAGKDAIIEVPGERWDKALYFDPEKGKPGKTYASWGGYIEDIDLFDPAYFKIDEQDAIAMDPTHRIALELSQELLDRAGYTHGEIEGTRTAVYLGGGESGYFRLSKQELKGTQAQHMVVNMIPNMMAARISDFYNLKGSSKTVDTACSSSLVAIHEACQMISHGTIDMAIAGGAELLLDPHHHVGFSQAQVLSDEPMSYVFDKRAKGFVMGEGAGLVLLKSYEAAKRDGDQILGVIIGGAVNNDGHTMGLTVPDLEGQQAVIEEALQIADITPDTIGYLEAHGTGTLLGDPIEIKAATQVYKKYTQEKGFCAVGSVKANIGHLMRAAGIASFIKTLLMLQHKSYVPTIHCEEPHPRFKFDESPFYPNTKTKPWQLVHGDKRRAAISSFGFGGTNCHLILEETPNDYQSRRKPLALTAFDKRRYWLGVEETTLFSHTYHYGEPYMKDHLVFEKQVLLGATHLSLFLEAIFKLQQEKKGTFHIKDLMAKKAIQLKDNESINLQVACHKKREDQFFLTVQSERGEIANAELNWKQLQKVSKIELKKLQKQSKKQWTKDEIYQDDKEQAVHYGPSLKSIDKLYIKDKEVLVEWSLSEELKAEPYHIHPSFIDAAIFGTLFPQLEKTDATYLPLFFREVIIYSIPKLDKGFSFGQVTKKSNEVILADFFLCDEKGQVFLEVRGFTCKRVREPEDLLGSKAKEKPPMPKKQLVRKKEYQLQEDLFSAVSHYLKEKIGQLVEGEVESEKNLMDIGVDSASLISLTQEIEKELGLELYPTVFFEYPSLQEFAEYLTKNERQKIGQYFGVQKEKLEVIKEPLEEKPRDEETKKEAVILRHISQGPQDNSLAIVGMDGIFAGSSNLDEFWQHLEKSDDLIKEIPEDHFDYHPWFDPNPEAIDKMYCKWGSFIDDVALFDASFFNISPREAEWMDPQLRKFLQVLYRTAEDAGCIAQLRGSNTGIYVGICFHDYAEKFARRGLVADAYQGTGNASTMIANRPSFYFDLKGPSIPIDTACSSSLVALHLACKAILAGECEQAFVGGVNLLLHSYHYRYFCALGALSPTGRCHTFDKRADGYIPGEAIAAILIKPLSKAIADGDQIHGVILGSGMNHGGYTPSVTAPSAKLEAEVIQKAWKDAGVDPESISYFEAHGTGTKLGDPVEIEGVKRAFKSYTKKEGFCAIGSAKAHIGHAEGAAGIAGIIKVLLQMKHKKIPAMPDFKELNPFIDIKKSPLIINQQLQDWTEEKGVLRRAGVSSFGFGGAYAHVVIEEYQTPKVTPIPITKENPAILVLSAKTKEQLKSQVQQLRTCLEKEKDLASIAYTLQVGREAMEERFGVIVSSLDELKEKLEGYLKGEEQLEIYRGCVKRYKDVLDLFHADKSLQKAIDEWIDEKKYGKLLALWVKGLVFDWNHLYGKVKSKRISLPTYPFAKKRYWLREQEKKEPVEVVEKREVSIGLEKEENQKEVVVQKQVDLDEEVLKIKSKAKRILKEILLLEEEIAEEKNFAELGMDSILGIEFLQKINEEFNVKIVGSDLYSYPNLKKLANFLASYLVEGKTGEKFFVEKNKVEEKEFVHETPKEIVDQEIEKNVKQKVKETVKEILYLDEEISETKNFSELGMDSILGIEFLQKINKEFNIKIVGSDLYSYPNIKKLTGFIVTFLGKVEGGIEVEKVEVSERKNRFDQNWCFNIVNKSD